MADSKKKTQPRKPYVKPTLEKNQQLKKITAGVPVVVSPVNDELPD